MGVANERREGCDGCDRTMAVGELRTVSMPDGNALACCPQCEPHARSAAEKLEELDTNRDQCDGCREEFKTSSLTDVVLTDGTVITVCPTCIREVPGNTSYSEETRAGTEETTEIARRKNLCSQCHEWCDEELYRVTLLDERTEELCNACKSSADSKGIVLDVKMRKTEARDILGIDHGADDRTIRQAFLTQIKHAHPDRKTGSREAFRLVKAAYDRLA
ncbi:J domain-containing protein [Halovivax gelatinilyticus]|uniref:J domain-containing protein n=1 Tax=Halovivax gelatinilyticus TaxID=2961597 RepID=UPI0020CA61FD|nr:J domain-containing protein [Halovivax gelatinilyticus]